MLRIRIALIALLLSVIPLTAQYDTSDYHWELADIAFSYPASWDEPLAVQRFGVESLVIAQSEVQNFERSPDIPIIMFALQPADADISIKLQERLTEIDIQPHITIPTTVMNQSGAWAKGNSEDSLFFGIGISTRLDDNILTIVGRVPFEQYAYFETIFDTLTRSLVQGTIIAESVPFGIIWDNSADIQDDETAFVSLSAIALDEARQIVYAVDESIGLLQFNMLSGRLESIIPNDAFGAPSAIALHPDGTIYIGDILCRCIHVYQDNEWQDSLTGFAADSPLYIIITADGDVYATDTDGENYFVRRYNADGSRNLFAEEPLEEQPILFLLNGELSLLNPDTGIILSADGVGFSQTATLETEITPQQVHTTADNTYIISSGSLIELYTSDSLLIESFNIDEYSLSSIVQGLSLGTDGTLYVATSDEEIGEILALSKRVPDIGTGLQTLMPYRTSSRFLNEDNLEDIWLIDGTAGDILSLFVHGDSSFGDFEFSMTFLAPDGTEIITIGEDDDRLGQLSRGFMDYELPDTGIYEVHINRLSSQGSYEITPITVESFILVDVSTTVWGELNDHRLQEMWAFEASAGITIDITLESAVPTRLDPQIRVYDSQFNLLGQNDDADNSELGNAAQLTGITLPREGIYYIDALHFDGEGKYNLTVEIIEPDSS